MGRGIVRRSEVVAGSTYAIRWADADPDSDASIALYSDTDDNGLDGSRIAGDLPEDPDGAGNTYVWDLTAVPAGTYWIYGVIGDNQSGVSSYSSGTVTVDKHAPRTTVNPRGGTYTDAVTVSLSVADDTDVNPVIRYTVDGLLPTSRSPVYSGPLTLTMTTPLRFFATDAAGRQEEAQGPCLYVIVPASLTVTPAAGANGSISPSTPRTVYYNQTTSFTVAPNGGYRIGSVTGCGGSLDGSLYTTGPITASCTVAATFVASRAVTVLAPNGGESFRRGTTPTTPIAWITNGTGQTVNKVTLSYSTNDGGSWTKITDLGNNPGTYTWTLPGTKSNRYRVLVELFHGNKSIGSDESDAGFTVAQ